MNNLTRWAAIAVLPVMLSACAGYQLQTVKGLKPSGDAFFQNAYAGYLDRAEHDSHPTRRRG